MANYSARSSSSSASQPRGAVLHEILIKAEPIDGELQRCQVQRHRAESMNRAEIEYRELDLNCLECFGASEAKLLKKLRPRRLQTKSERLCAALP